MIDAIRDHLFRRHFKKLNLPRSEYAQSEVNRLRSATVLAATPHHTIGDLQEAVDFFDRSGILCQGYYIDLSKTPPEPSSNIDVITKEDVIWIGIPRKELLIKWLSYSTDLLISLNPGHSALMRYLCAASNCQLKTAIDYGNAQEKAIDFYLQVRHPETKNLRELCAAIYEALKNIS